MRINKKKMFAAAVAATLVSSAYVAVSPQPASAAVNTNTAKGLVSKAENSAYRLHTLYTTVGRYHVITTELTTAKSQYASAIKAVNGLSSSSTKTDLVKRLQKVKGYIDRATTFNNALYAASNLNKHINYVNTLLGKDTYNRTQLKAELNKQQKMAKTMDEAIRKVYSKPVLDRMYNKYLPLQEAPRELAAIVNDKMEPYVIDVAETKYNVVNIAVSDVSGLNPSAAMNRNNYKIDGKVIPANSVIKVVKSESHRSIVQISLPQESISQTKTYTLSVSGLKDKFGTVNAHPSTHEVTLTDNVSPVLKEVKINESQPNELIFSYSEPLAAPIKPSDIKIKYGYSTIPASKIKVKPELNESGQPTGRDLVSLQTEIYGQVDMWDQYYVDIDDYGGYNEDQDVMLGASDSFTSAYSVSAGTNGSTVSVDKSPNRNLLKTGTAIQVIGPKL
jgi:hypothetical protein